MSRTTPEPALGPHPQATQAHAIAPVASRSSAAALRSADTLTELGAPA